MKKLMTMALLGVTVALGTYGQVRGNEGPPASQAQVSATPGAAELPQAAHNATTYLCQKCYNGKWCTVYTCYCYSDACSWYNNQPGNARIVAQK